MVAPSGNLASAASSRLSGMAVVATFDNGGTSGRFEVAKYAARLFPEEEQTFIAGVIAEGIEPKSDFPSGPYPADKTTYKNARLVEFETPANKDGLGTSDRLQKNAQPIYGMAALKDSPDGPNFFLVTIRLPAKRPISCRRSSPRPNRQCFVASLLCNQFVDCGNSMLRTTNNQVTG